LLYDARNAVVALGGAAAARPERDPGWIELNDEVRLPFLEGHARVVDGPVGLATAYALPAAGTSIAVDDLWTVDLGAVAAGVHARRAGTTARPVSLAALRSSWGLVDPRDALSELLGLPVVTVGAEASAARVGALSTPGADPGAVVVDLGGGTLDVVSPSSEVVAAGAGGLLTVSVAALTGVSAAAAEWVKRGPAHRVEAPQVLMAEDGTRDFLDRPAAADTIGSLVVAGPAGLLPFSRTLAPGEWRALRVALKVALVGGNVARGLRTIAASPGTVVAVGGPAGDDEVLAALAGALPGDTAVGRGDVAGQLGHRYAVAYGLLLLSGNDLS
jgi:Diol dehydratase reactivase ATPase-like domain